MELDDSAENAPADLIDAVVHAPGVPDYSAYNRNDDGRWVIDQKCIDQLGGHRKPG